MIITQENVDLGHLLMKDALLAFWEMAVGYDGTGADVDFGSIDPKLHLYIRAKDPGSTDNVDPYLIRSAAAMCLAQQMMRVAEQGFAADQNEFIRLGAELLKTEGAAQYQEHSLCRDILIALTSGDVEAATRAHGAAYTELVKGYFVSITDGRAISRIVDEMNAGIDEGEDS